MRGGGAATSQVAMKPVLVTGAAGFIGFHVARRLLADGGAVVALDNLNSYYDPNLKNARLDELLLSLTSISSNGISQITMLWRNCLPHTASAMSSTWRHKPAFAIRCAIRTPLPRPTSSDFLNILEGCRHVACKHLIYASSSSVYGANTHMPLRASDNTDHPLEPIRRN